VSSRPRPGAPQRSEAEIELGIELLTRIAALLRIGRSYSANNRLFAQQIESLMETTGQLLAERGEFLFVCYGREVFLDGQRIATTAHGFRMAKTLVAAFEERGIAGFEVLGEPRHDEWTAFFELLMNRGLPVGPAWDEQAEQRGLARIVPVKRVQEDPACDSDSAEGPGADPKDRGAAEAAPDDRSENPEGSAGAVGGRMSPSTAAALGAAPKLYASALAGLNSLLTSTSAQNGLEMRHARRVVQPIVDAAGSRDPVILGLAGMVKRDEYSYARNVNACMIATSIGQKLGFDRADLATLAVCALLHGIGRAEATEPHRIGPAGALLLARRTPMQELTTRVMRVALEAGGGSAPPGRSSILSQIVSIAATYTRMVSARGHTGKATTPAQALGMIVGPLTGGFDPALKAALVETVGLHPPGQMVELDDGTIALVIAPSRTDLDRPIVQPCSGPWGQPLDPNRDWSGGALPPERSIIRDLTASEMPDGLDAAA
jgi:HD-GYP domain-containing protein (c-di-GMP phosphodiesterase class II)